MSKLRKKGPPLHLHDFNCEKFTKLSIAALPSKLP